jgi:hypothetical protein
MIRQSLATFAQQPAEDLSASSHDAKVVHLFAKSRVPDPDVKPDPQPPRSFFGSLVTSFALAGEAFHSWPLGTVDFARIAPSKEGATESIGFWTRTVQLMMTRLKFRKRSHSCQAYRIGNCKTLVSADRLGTTTAISKWCTAFCNHWHLPW